MKICIKCNTEKPLEEFTKSAKSKDGRGSYCVVCQRAYTAQWRIDNYDQKRASEKKYDLEHPEERKEAHRSWKQNNPDKVRSYARTYAKDKPEKALLYEARKRAKEFGLPFSLTDKNIVIPVLCPILGIKLMQGSVDNNRDCCPSLDRVFPELGYVPNNIAVISYRANRIKNNGTSAEHRKIADWMDGFGVDIPAE